MGQEFKEDTAGTACLCSVMTVATAGKPKGLGLELSEDFTGSEDLLPRWCTHMAGKLVLAVDEMAHFSPCGALLKDARVSS